MCLSYGSSSYICPFTANHSLREARRYLLPSFSAGRKTEPLKCFKETVFMVWLKLQFWSLFGLTWRFLGPSPCSEPLPAVKFVLAQLGLLYNRHPEYECRWGIDFVVATKPAHLWYLATHLISAVIDLDSFLLLTDYNAVDKWVRWWQTVSMLSGEGQQCVTLAIETVIKGDKL